MIVPVDKCSIIAFDFHKDVVYIFDYPKSQRSTNVFLFHVLWIEYDPTAPISAKCIVKDIRKDVLFGEPVLPRLLFFLVVYFGPLKYYHRRKEIRESWMS